MHGSWTLVPTFTQFTYIGVSISKCPGSDESFERIGRKITRMFLFPTGIPSQKIGIRGAE
jgi:hypothetical protein